MEAVCTDARSRRSAVSAPPAGSLAPNITAAGLWRSAIDST